MVRTQIQLDEAQAGALKRVAAERRVSMAAAIRLAVDAFLRANAQDQRAAQRERALAVVGAFSAEPQLSRNHDAVFAEEDRK